MCHYNSVLCYCSQNAEIYEMNYLSFREKLRDFAAFNLSDIRKIDAGFDLRRLSEWQAKGYLKMIRRGHYVFSDL